MEVKEAVGYMLQGKYYSLQNGEKGAFFFNNCYFPVTADNIRQGNEHPRILRCLQMAENSYKALEGANFLLAEPPYTVLGYYEGERLVPLQAGEQFWIAYEGGSYPLRWEGDLEYLRNPQCTPWILCNGQWREVPSKHFFVGEKIPVPELPHPPAAGQPAEIQPAAPLPQPVLQPAAPMPAPLPSNPVQEERKIIPQLAVVPQPSMPNEGATALSKRCQDCKSPSTQYMAVPSICCSRCLLGAITSGNLSTGSGPAWSEGIICDVMNFLRNTQLRDQLPAYIPLPKDHFVCSGKNKPFAPGYPPRGHIIGKAFVIAEGGCPNKHVLCKECANYLSNCPQCQAFIFYEECPRGCPLNKDSCDHCADFDRACEVPGCTGGRWPRRKQRQ